MCISNAHASQEIEIFNKTYVLMLRGLTQLLAGEQLWSGVADFQ